MNISLAQCRHIRLITGMVRLLGSSVAYSKGVGFRDRILITQRKVAESEYITRKSLIVLQSQGKRIIRGFLGRKTPKVIDRQRVSFGAGHRGSRRWNFNIPLNFVLKPADEANLIKMRSWYTPIISFLNKWGRSTFP